MYWVLVHWSSSAQRISCYHGLGMEIPEGCKSEIASWLSYLHPPIGNLPVEVQPTNKEVEGTDSGVIISQWVKALLKGEQIADIGSELGLVRHTMALEIAQMRARV